MRRIRRQSSFGTALVACAALACSAAAIQMGFEQPGPALAAPSATASHEGALALSQAADARDSAPVAAAPATTAPAAHRTLVAPAGLAAPRMAGSTDATEVTDSRTLTE